MEDPPPAESEPGSRMLVATHSGPIRAFAITALGYDPGLFALGVQARHDQEDVEQARHQVQTNDHDRRVRSSRSRHQ